MERHRKMGYYDDIVSDDEFFREAKKEQLSRDQLLDENFKKAEKSRRKKDLNNKKNEKKPFLKSGILLLLIAVICLVITNVLPWAYVKCDDSSGEQEIEKFVYSKEDASDIENPEVLNIFDAPEVNATFHSSNFIGISFDDFKSSANILNFGFILLALMAIIFIVFQILDRSKEVFKNGFMLFHTAFSCMTILVSFFLLFTAVRFFSVYPLLSYNSNFINTENVFILFPVPIILSVILLIIIKAAFSIIKIYMKKMNSKLKGTGKKENPLSFYGG